MYFEMYKNKDALKSLVVVFLEIVNKRSVKKSGWASVIFGSHR